MILFFLACDLFSIGKDECASDTAMNYTLEMGAYPDFTMELPEDTADKGLAGEWWVAGTRYEVQAWDCAEISWWSSVKAQKMVQVISLDCSCEDGNTVDLSTYDCDSHTGMDAPWRDWDGDGLTAYDGDCDDEDATIGACE
jgi:hypothetical protein